MEQRDLGSLFLINFIQDILQIKAPIQKEEINQPLLNPVILPVLEPQLNKIIQPIKEIQKFRPVEIKIIKRQPDIKIINDIKPLENIQKNQNLGTLIKDPYVEEIECVDVQSPLVVKKFGSIQKTQVKLSIEEIYELIAEFSQKSRIPVINGKIRAALNNLIITATLSGSSGPSFIIQKKKY